MAQRNSAHILRLCFISDNKGRSFRTTISECVLGRRSGNLLPINVPRPSSETLLWWSSQCWKLQQNTSSNLLDDPARPTPLSSSVHTKSLSFPPSGITGVEKLSAPDAVVSKQRSSNKLRKWLSIFTRK